MPEIAETRVDGIRARRAKVMSWSWRTESSHSKGHTVWGSINSTGSMLVATTGYADTFDKDNAEFIANAPADIDYLLTQLDARPGASAVEELAQEAAEKWFSESARTSLNRYRFVTQLASIIASVFTESETLEQVIADGGFSTIARERVRADRERERTQPLPTGEREKVFRETIGLLNSMVLCGENHSDRSRAQVKLAIDLLNARPSLEREKERLQQIRKIADLGSAQELDDAYDRLEAIVRIAG